MREEKAKIIFFKTDNNPIPEYFYNLLSFLDISKEQIVFLDEIKQYKNVIVPEQAMVLFSGFHPVVNNIYDSIVNYVEKNTEIVHQKIYLSRTKYEPKDCINEEYFERIYEEKGFVIIHPEQESLEKQIALVRGATHIVCTAGTLSYMVLFARKGIKVTILLRENEVGAVSPQLLINQMKEVECEIIDVSLNFLPTTHARGTFLLGPSQGWEKYAKEVFGEVKENEIDIELKKNCYEYVKLWISRYSSNNYAYKRINKMDIFDVVNRMNYVFNHKELSRTAMATPKINESQIKNELNRILIPRDLRVVCPSNHKFIMTWFEEDSGKKKVYLQKRSLTKRIKSNLSTIEAMNYMQHIYKKSSVIITRVKGFTIEDSLIEKFKNSNIDIVLLNHCKLGETIEKQYIKSHGKESWDMMMNVLKEKNKVYYDAAMSIFQGNELFTQNSYIMKKETFNIYISWIKPLIEEIEKRLENKDLLDKLIERLFTLYFLHNKEKYVEAFWVSE